MSSVSHLERSDSMTLILSETFAPPRMATKGRVGLLMASPRNLSSF